MKITETRLRKLIREELMIEARLTPEDIPEGIMFNMKVSVPDGMILLIVTRGAGEVGRLESSLRYAIGQGPCWDAFVVDYVTSGIDGLGPLMYDVVMEMATEIGGGLISDRDSVTPEARRVWKKYQDSRSDVKRLQLDSLDDEITKGFEDDNCDLKLSKRAAGDELPMWRDYPLSGAYRKPGMETIRRLADLKKIYIRGFQL